MTNWRNTIVSLSFCDNSSVTRTYISEKERFESVCFSDSFLKSTFNPWRGPYSGDLTQESKPLSQVQQLLLLGEMGAWRDDESWVTSGDLQ